MTTEGPAEDLFARLGGSQAVERLVAEAYDRILQDPELAPYFENVDMGRLQRMQHEFLSAAFGGPIAYTGADIQAAHRHLHIQSRHFSRFVQHFIECLENWGADRDTVDGVLGRLAMYHDRVVGSANVDG
ncbi:MAG: hemin transporter [Pirellulaceae bacterium]|nr:MAG: hemin transporter [Pirellulaceae bacterium]